MFNIITKRGKSVNIGEKWLTFEKLIVSTWFNYRNCWSDYKESMKSLISGWKGYVLETSGLQRENTNIKFDAFL